MDTRHLSTLPEVVRAVARARPQAPAFDFEGRRTTYAEFDRHTDQVARALRAAGLAAGARIAYVGRNSDHFYELLIGANKAGIVFVPVGWRLAAPEIAWIVAHSESELLFAGRESLAAAARIAAAAPTLRGLIALEADDGGRFPCYAAWRDAQPARAPDYVSRSRDVALQLYTSGTTGRPKGVMMAHDNLLVSARMSNDPAMPWMHWEADDVALIAMPLSHLAGVGWGLRSLVAGARGVVMREFDPHALLDLIERERISKMLVVPAALQIVLRDPRCREVDFSRLKYLLYGASPIPAALLRESIEAFGCGFVQCYGMTETCGTVTALTPADHLQPDSPRIHSVGRAMPWAEVAVADVDGRRLPPGEVGEIIVRSSQNMAGYWRDPQETARAVSAHGWLRTGDAGYMDADGYVYIRDRIKDMIISGGENIYPAEVESALYGHPQVADVAVIGVPDERWGEAVRAFVVLRAGAAPDAAGILAWARERLAGFKLPKNIEFVDALPRNPSGKLLRRRLREPYWRDRERQVN